MGDTPEADRLASLSDAELIEEAYRNRVGNRMPPAVRLAYGLAILALLAMAAAAAIIYKKLGDA